MKILIVDDHPLVREGLSSVLMLEPGCEIAGKAASAAEAMELISTVHPDIVILDLRLKDGCGFDIVVKTKDKGIRCKFVILTSSTDKRDFEQAQKIGADGYILKEAFPEDILYAIRIVGQGRKYFDPNLMEIIMKDPKDDFDGVLTSREYVVLTALSQGMSNSEIARKLFISECTVKKHVSQILYKLNLNDRTQAAIYATTRGLVG